jgi:PAS domain S-box-containing protein
MLTRILIALQLITTLLIANEKVSLQLQWKYQFQFAGYIMAKEKGFYDAVALDVDIKEWEYGVNMVDDIMKGKTTFSIVRSTAFIDNSNKNDIVFLAAIFQSSPLVLLADKSSGIQEFKDLKNKKLMSTTDLSTDASLVSMLFSQHISFGDMNNIKQTFNVEDLKNGHADLMAAYISNEPYVLKQLGGTPVIFNPKDYGFDFYSDILVTNRKSLEQNPELVKKFTSASLLGWEYAFEHIEETAAILHEKYNSLHKSKEAFIYEGKELKKLAYNGTDPLGTIKKEKLERIYDVYKLLGLSNTKILFNTSIYKIPTPNKELNETEKAYIKNNNIVKVCTNPNWTPIEFTTNNGEPNGVSIDLLKLVGEKAGLEFQFIKTKTWGESQEYLKNKKCDILPAAIKTPKREKYANFTKPHSIYDLAIITKDDKPLVENLDAMSGKLFSRKADSGLISVIRSNYPSIKIKETKSYKGAFEAVENGDAYFTIATLPVLSFYKNAYNFDKLQIAGYTGIKYKLSIAVRDDNILLLNILDKTLLSISNESKKIISEKWLVKPFESQFNYALFRNIAIVIFVLFLFFIYKQYMLRKSFNEIDEIINATIEGVIIFKDNICIDINQSGVDLLGYSSKKELLGKNIFTFVPEKHIPFAKEKLTKESVQPYEFHILKKDNTILSVLLNGHYIKNRDVFLISIVDITQLKQQEAQLLQQAKLVSMGEMIGNIAHQWRQPLSVISTSATGIKVQKEYGLLEDKFLFEACDAIDNNVQYLSKTIDDFKNFVKGDRIKLNFKANEFVQSLLNLIEPSTKNHNIHIVQNIDKDLIINGYKNELLQCFMNIYNNSKDALDSNKNIKEKLIFITITKENDKIILSFKDNGGGIQEDILPKIFEPYFTTKHQSQGTGLGLHMAYNLITTGMKGTIHAQNSHFEHNSQKYIGAEFIIQFDES